MAAADPPIDQECVEGYVYTVAPARVLVLRRPPARGRIWVPVSGKMEPSDPDLAAGLRRELREETGYQTPTRVFPLGWEVPFVGPTGGRWRLHAFGVELARPDPPRLSPEHDGFEWVEPPEAIRRLHYEDNQEAVRRLLAQVPALSAGAASTV